MCLFLCVYVSNLCVLSLSLAPWFSTMLFTLWHSPFLLRHIRSCPRFTIAVQFFEHSTNVNFIVWINNLQLFNVSVSEMKIAATSECCTCRWRFNECTDKNEKEKAMVRNKQSWWKKRATVTTNVEICVVAERYEMSNYQKQIKLTARARIKYSRSFFFIILAATIYYMFQHITISLILKSAKGGGNASFQVCKNRFICSSFPSRKTFYSHREWTGKLGFGQRKSHEKFVSSCQMNTKNGTKIKKEDQETEEERERENVFGHCTSWNKWEL